MDDVNDGGGDVDDDSNVCGNSVNVDTEFGECFDFVFECGSTAAVAIVSPS